jgi:hypothetical protein
MLINRLNKLAVGEVDCTPAQIRALEIALKKTLPDLTASVGADGGDPVQKVQHLIRIVDADPNSRHPSEAAASAPGNTDDKV